MGCCISDLRDKEIINVCDGTRLGFVEDIEVDVVCGKVITIIASGECRSLFGKNTEVVIPWECIECIGEETILVRVPEPPISRGGKLEKKKIRFF